MLIGTALVAIAILLAFIVGFLIFNSFNKKEKYQYKEAKEILEAHEALENLRAGIRHKMKNLNEKTLTTLAEDMHPKAMEFYLQKGR